MIVRLLPDAEAEVQQQELWYWRRGETAARGFMAALDRGLQLIAASPEMGRRYRRGTRRLVLTSLPFSIVYRIEEDVMYVVAVTHAKLRPGYWHSRVTEYPQRQPAHRRSMAESRWRRRTRRIWTPPVK